MASISNENGCFIDHINLDKCYNYDDKLIDQEQLIIELYRFIFIDKKTYGDTNKYKRIIIKGTPESIYEDFYKLKNNGVAIAMPENMIYAPD